MEQILHAFGIDGRLIIIQIINFAILAGALWYFLYTPVLKLLNEREAKIKKGIEDAQKAEVSLTEAEYKKNELIHGARKEAVAIVQQGVSHGEEKQRSIIDEANQKIARQIAQATLDAEQIKENARKESDAEITKLAILGAEKILATGMKQ